MTYTLEQQKANRKLWIEALRGGKYEQTKAELHNNIGFCCLGVACDVLGYQWMRNGDSYHIEGWGGRHDTLLPPEAAAKLGLYMEDSDRQRGDWWLANANDGGKSFAEIADIIESEPKGLFVESVE